MLKQVCGKPSDAREAQVRQLNADVGERLSPHPGSRFFAALKSQADPPPPGEGEESWRFGTTTLARRLEPLFGQQPHRGVGVHRLAEGETRWLGMTGLF